LIEENSHDASISTGGGTWYTARGECFSTPVVFTTEEHVRVRRTIGSASSPWLPENVTSWYVIVTVKKCSVTFEIILVVVSLDLDPVFSSIWRDWVGSTVRVAECV
jgi:hypothetical protein